MTPLTTLGLIWIFTKQNWLLVPVLGFMAWIGLAEYLHSDQCLEKMISLLIFILGFSTAVHLPAWLISATPLAKDNAVLDLLQKDPPCHIEAITLYYYPPVNFPDTPPTLQFVLVKPRGDQVQKESIQSGGFLLTTSKNQRI